MGEHIDYRSQKKKKLKEHSTDARQNRITFKRYLRDLEEEFLDLDLDDPIDDAPAKDLNQDE